MSHRQSLIPFPRMPDVCRECGCNCSLCENNSLDWHHKIEELRAKLSEMTARSSQTERELTESRYRADLDVARLQDDLAKQRDRYDRLYESHKRLQKLNNELECKLLTVVSKLEREKAELTESLGNMQQKLTEVETMLHDIESERERLKSDCMLAVQLLHCRPSDFIAYKLSELPLSLQERVRGQLSRKEIMELEDECNDSTEPLKPLRIPVPTFPPTAVCALKPVNESQTDEESGLRRINTVPMSLVARALLPPDEDERSSRKRHGDVYVCSVCRRSDSTVDCNRSATVELMAEAGVRLCPPSPGIHIARRSPIQPSLTLTRS